jgi:hypothetical protein
VRWIEREGERADNKNHGQPHVAQIVNNDFRFQYHFALDRRKTRFSGPKKII